MYSEEIRQLELMSYEMRKDSVNMAHRSGNVCHIGPAFSCADIVTALYFKIMKIDPKNPHWEDRDQFVISKGHACIVVYAALARLGYFDMDELWKVKDVNAMLQGHPDMKKIPGIDATAGSLGNGFSFALGIAMGLRYQKKKSRVYTIIGDGDAQEGVVWEAAMLAGSRKVDNLVAILDYNHLQGSGCTEDIIDMEPFAEKWKAFGWNVMEMNGHNMADILNKLEMASYYYGRPTIIIAHTLKGKGVSFMEHNNDWHARPLHPEEHEQAIAELDKHIEEITAKQ